MPNNNAVKYEHEHDRVTFGEQSNIYPAEIELRGAIDVLIEVDGNSITLPSTEIPKLQQALHIVSQQINS